MTKSLTIACATAVAVTLAACSGGGGSSSPPPVVVATTAPTATPTPASAQPQVISLALPTTAIGYETDPTYGLIGGYTQTGYSQTVAFAPGSQIMIANGDSGRPHTLGDLGVPTFPTVGSNLSPTRSASDTFGANWQSGTMNAGTMIGPITLTAGTYWIGCDFHYESSKMRDVLVVAAGATPGPHATAVPGAPSPAPTGGGFGGY